jgi:hypothetical protein
MLASSGVDQMAEQQRNGIDIGRRRDRKKPKRGTGSVENTDPLKDCL